jgi:ketosteroid isomerase-like protein
MKNNKTRSGILGLITLLSLTLGLTAQADCKCKKNMETVRTVYSAFQKGDIPTILSHVSADVKWEIWETGNTAQDQGVPYMQPKEGKTGVGEFFASLANVTFHEFAVKNIMAGGNQVTGLVYLDATFKPTGKSLKDFEIHLFTFNDKGEINGFKHFLDTAKHIEAITPNK